MPSKWLVSRWQTPAADIGTPLLGHGGNDVDLLAVEDCAQLFAISQARVMCLVAHWPTRASRSARPSADRRWRSLSRWSATPRMKAGDMSMLTEVICSRCALWVAVFGKRVRVFASRPWATNTTLRSLASAAMVK
jgi:hypothetical protein